MCTCNFIYNNVLHLIIVIHDIHYLILRTVQYHVENIRHNHMGEGVMPMIVPVDIMRYIYMHSKHK